MRRKIKSLTNTIANKTKSKFFFKQKYYKQWPACLFLFKYHGRRGHKITTTQPKRKKIALKVDNLFFNLEMALTTSK